MKITTTIMFSLLVGLGSGYPLKNYGDDSPAGPSVDGGPSNDNLNPWVKGGPSVDNLGGPSVDDGTSNPSLEEIYEKFKNPKPSIDGTSADDLFDPKSIEDNPLGAGPSLSIATSPISPDGAGPADSTSAAATGNAPMTAVNAANVLSTKFDVINVPIGNSIKGLPPSYLKPITYTNTKPNTYEVLTGGFGNYK